MRRSAAAAAMVVAVLAAGCGGERAPAGRSAGGRSPSELVDQERYDEAIARLEGATDAESLWLLGRAWAGKAGHAALPAPAAGTKDGDGLFKPEELRAIDAFERATAVKQDYAAAHLALAELLAPHALARLHAPQRRLPGGGAAPAPVGGVPDTSPDRVIHCYGAAMQADPASTEAGEALIRFATAAGRLSDADAGYQELLRRRREDPSLLVRYGDFLAGPSARPDAALAPYGQALMWRPEDTATRRKVADIHLRAAAGELGQQRYALAEARLAEARRAGADPDSPQAARLRQLEQALGEVRGR